MPRSINFAAVAGGVSVEKGTYFQKCVAAAAVASSLERTSFFAEDAMSRSPVRIVRIETGNDVDDMELQLDDQRRVFIQAKYRLHKGQPLKDALLQCAAAIGGNFDPIDHVVIVCAEISESVRDMRRMLLRYKQGLPGALNSGETTSREWIRDVVSNSSAAQVRLIAPLIVDCRDASRALRAVCAFAAACASELG